MIYVMIKSVKLVQRLGDLDAACALALLQEEADSSRCQDYRSSDGSFFPKPSLKPSA
jgi:hypothetical protein